MIFRSRVVMQRVALLNELMKLLIIPKENIKITVNETAGLAALERKQLVEFVRVREDFDRILEETLLK